MSEATDTLVAGLPQTLGENLGAIQKVTDVLIDFAVNYSFQVFGAVIILIAGLIVARVASRALLRMMERHDVDVTLRQFIASCVRLIIIIAFVVIALQNLGVSITPFIAAIGGLAVGISFALQAPVANYGAGLVIILTRMFRVGDTIVVQGWGGLVDEITLAHTRLTAEDGEAVVIPNKHIVGEVLVNSFANRVVEGSVGVAYDTDPVAAVALLEQTLARVEGVLQDPPPQVGIASFGESSIDLAYRYNVPTGRFFAIQYSVNMAVFQALKAADISIPYPVRTVQIEHTAP